MTAPRLGASQTKALDAEEAAALWLVIRERGFSPSEERRFSAWLGESEQNAAAWRRAERLWSSFDEEPDVLLETMRAAALRVRPSAAAGVGRALIAASLAAIVVLAGLSSWRWAETRMAELREAHRGQEKALAASELSSGPAVRSNVTLPDGTGLTLDSLSAVRVDYTKARRGIRLIRGQAFFSVAHDPGRPFVVQVDGRSVTALGTAFAVSLKDASMTVVLAAGSVLVSPNGDREAEVRLSPGQQYLVTPGGPGVVSAVDVAQALAWRSGYLEFRDVPLAEAVAEIDRHGGPTITVGDAVAASVRVSGRFRVGDPARFARALAEAYPVRVEQSEGLIRIVHR